MIVQLKKTKRKIKIPRLYDYDSDDFYFWWLIIYFVKRALEIFYFFSSSMTSQLMNYFNNVYTKPQTRASPYLVGTTLGYIIFKKIVFPRNHKLVNFSLQFSIHFFFLCKRHLLEVKNVWNIAWFNWDSGFHRQLWHQLQNFYCTPKCYIMWKRSGADSDYRNVRTCEPWKIFLVKNRGNVVKNRVNIG